MNIVIGSAQAVRQSKVDRLARVLIGSTAALFLLVVITLWSVLYLPGYLGFRNYQPQEGDLVFQSLPHSRLVNAIEGATHSPFSHCGIVAKENGRWVVYEAYRNVDSVPLRQFTQRGRGEAFAVYRLRPEYQPHVANTVAEVRRFRGRPYDERYRLDDDAEAIYCSELIYLAYRAASNEELGKLVTLGELKWQPYLELIEKLEGGPPPLDRQMITPRDLAAAEQLQRVYSYGYGRGEKN